MAKGKLQNRFQVIVGNIGQVYSGHDRTRAEELYNEYVEISKSGSGRAGGEQVTLMMNDEPFKEHTPPDPQEGESEQDPTLRQPIIEILKQRGESLLDGVGVDEKVAGEIADEILDLVAKQFAAAISNGTQHL